MNSGSLVQHKMNMRLASPGNSGRKDSMKMRGFVAFLLYVGSHTHYLISEMTAILVSWILCTRLSAFMCSIGEV